MPKLSDFFEHVLENVLGDDPKPVQACPNCAMTLEDFEQTGLLGCDRCYEVFENELSVLLRQIHGSDEHVGGRPKFSSTRSRGEPGETLSF